MKAPNMEEKAVSLEEASTLAVQHMKRKNYRVAEMVLQDILSSVPDHGDSLYLLGLARYYMGNLDGAIEQIEKAVEDEEAYAEWWCNYGIMLTECARYDEAIKAFDNAIATDADYCESYWNQSHAYWLAGEYERAEKTARKGVDLKPDSAEAWLNMGTAIVRLGRLEEAVECWEKALEIQPDFVFAWNNLGNVLRELGQLEAAAEKCRKALEIQHDYPQAQNNLANALMDLGDLKESEQLYRQAVTGKPDYAQAHNNLAINLIKQSRFVEAIQEARVALSYQKDYFEALLSLSTACRAVGQLEEAEKAVHRATLINPESAEVRIDLADLLYMQDRYGDAEIELERARRLAPDTPRLYLKLADVLQRGNKVEEALQAVDKAAQLNPEMPEAFLKKGMICHIANRIEEAKENFDKTLEMNPKAAGAFLAMAELSLSLGEKEQAYDYVRRAQKLAPDLPALFLTISKTKKFTEDDKDFQKMVKLEQSAQNFGIDQASALNFALFSAYEDIGDGEKAFEHLQKGNQLKRQLIPYDPALQEASFKALQEAYSPENLKAMEGKGFETDLPVFIVGMPRSGTTLTEQIISSHADVFGAGELMEIGTLDMEFGFLSAENALLQGQRYIEQVKVRDPSGKAKRITDKMPGNFSHLGKIVSILPQAKIIHTRRNPLDTCLSCYKQNFAMGQYWSYDLEDLARYYNNYLDLMVYWREVLPERFIEVDYEETVSEFEPRARALIDYIGLPWDDACLAPHKQKRAVLTASKQQVTKPIYTSSVKSWKKYEKQLAPLIEGLASGPAKDLLDL
ncbi:MAG: tetratricopeptide repeat protein [Alphaproteobacteria bacterium]|nr:tetratricopeptide repeat protein [Alphaproteobacteria bacterium]